MLPAVQKVREAAARISCANNLKQIGLALWHYHDSYRTFPPGAFWGSDATQDRGSILYILLPYVEQDALYRQYNHNAPPDDQTFPGTNKLLAGTPIPTYICPSDEAPTVSVWGRAKHNYAASCGPSQGIDNPNCSCSNGWNSYALAPYDDPNNFAGPFTRRGKPTQAQDVSDGLSNTIFFGEVRTNCSQHQTQGWGASNDGQGLTRTIYPINYNSCDHSATSASGNANCGRYCNWNTELAFGSRHPGGAQFLFGDGSVHFLAESIDHWTYQYLGGKADGHPVAIP